MKKNALPVNNWKRSFCAALVYASIFSGDVTAARPLLLCSSATYHLSYVSQHLNPVGHIWSARRRNEFNPLIRPVAIASWVRVRSLRVRVRVRAIDDERASIVVVELESQFIGNREELQDCQSPEMALVSELVRCIRQWYTNIYRKYRTNVYCVNKMNDCNLDGFQHL